MNQFLHNVFSGARCMALAAVALFSMSASAQNVFWEGETFTDGADNQNFYIYNVGWNLFLTPDNESKATTSDVNQANLWQLNHSKHNGSLIGGNKHDGNYYCTTIFYKDANGDEYRVKCVLGTSWSAKVEKSTSGATNFYISASEQTSGAYKVECYAWSQPRMFGINADSAYTAKSTTTDNTTDWLFISEAQKQAYNEYIDLYNELKDMVDNVPSLTEEATAVLEETANATYSTSADAIAKLKAMIDKMNGQMSGISSTTVSADIKAEAIYGASGEKRAALQHGINIVKMTDGSVKKIMVK